MRLEWSERAVRHLVAARAYMAEQDPRAAAEVAEALLAAARRLAEFPASGRPGRVPGTRELVIPGLPFILPYTVDGDRVIILAVLHTSRRWPEKPGSGRRLHDSGMAHFER